MKPTSVYAWFWLVLMLLATGNGILREMTYGKVLTDLQAHQLSTLTGCALLGIAAWLLARWCRLQSTQQALIIGTLWLALTVVFEFGFGHYVAGHSWQRLLQDYNLLAGRVWPLFLIWIYALPYIIFRITSPGKH